MAEFSHTSVENDSTGFAAAFWTIHEFARINREKFPVLGDNHALANQQQHLDTNIIRHMPHLYPHLLFCQPDCSLLVPRS